MLLLCPEFVIPTDHQGAESDVKAKEPFLHLGSGEIPGRESEFQKDKGFIGA